MSDADRTHASAHGNSLLPSDLTDDQLAAAATLASVDALVIEELSQDSAPQERARRGREGSAAVT